MCLTLPGRVVSVDDGTALVDLGPRHARAMTVLCPEVRPGEWVLVAAGMIVDQVSAAEARRIRALIEDASGRASGIRRGGTET